MQVGGGCWEGVVREFRMDMYTLLCLSRLHFTFLCSAVLVEVQSHASLEKSCLKFSCCRQIPALISLMREGKGRCSMEKKKKKKQIFFNLVTIFL